MKEADKSKRPPSSLWQQLLQEYDAMTNYALASGLDVPGRIVDGKLDNLLTAGIMQCDFVLFFVCVHCYMCYTVFNNDRLPSIVCGSVTAR